VPTPELIASDIWVSATGTPVPSDDWTVTTTGGAIAAPAAELLGSVVKASLLADTTLTVLLGALAAVHEL
jgi:hypothetical protein